MTKNGKALTAVGIKPICPFQQVFQSTYLFGAFSPITGDSFMLEMPSCNGDNFQLFLDEFSKENPDEFKIIVLDNGDFHKAKSLQIPNNNNLKYKNSLFVYPHPSPIQTSLPTGRGEVVKIGLFYKSKWY